MKKFYTLVSSEKTQNGYNVLLDGNTLKTQEKSTFHAPNESIANRVVEEWSSQNETIHPDAMPFTQILSTKIDRIAHMREAIKQTLLKYIDTDLICYMTENPEELAKQQSEIWGPWQNWFEKSAGVDLKTTNGLEAVEQSHEVHEFISRYIDGLDDDHFTILQLVASVSGSVILSIAFTDGKASADDILTAIYIEENFKNTLYDAEKYGEDPVIEKKKKADKANLFAYQDYLQSLS